MDKKICGTLIAALFIFSALTPLIAASKSGEIRTEPKYPWVIIAYVSLDNIQFGTFPSDLWGITEYILRIASLVVPESPPCILLYDGMTDGDSKIYSMGEKKVIDDEGAVIPQSNEVNYGDPDTMANFVIWAAREYPAQHYLLMMCHNYGWEGFNTDESSPGAPGGNGMDIITEVECRYALQKIDEAGVHIDVLFMDACEFTMLENLYQIAPYVDYIVGFEDLMTFDGMIPQILIPYLKISANPNISPEEVAIALTKSFPPITLMTLFSEFSSIYPGALMAELFGAIGGHISMPCCFAIKTSEIEAIAAATDLLAATLRYDIGLLSTARDAREGVRVFPIFPWIVDLCDFAERLYHGTDDEVVKSRCLNLMDAINSAIIEESKLLIDRGAHGISINFPNSKSEYSRSMQNYFDPSCTYYELEFAKDTQWDEFVAAYTEAVA
jgi:hypothetical protein